MNIPSIYVERIFRFNQITHNYIYYPVIIDNLWTQLTGPCSFKCSIKSSVTDGIVYDKGKLLFQELPNASKYRVLHRKGKSKRES